MRSTPQRLAVLEAIAGASGHPSSVEIVERLERRGAGLDRSTVYRALAQLCEAGILSVAHAGDGIARYELAAGGAHLHVGCGGCGRTEHVSAPELVKAMLALFSRAGVDLADRSLTVVGTCRSCGGTGEG